MFSWPPCAARAPPVTPVSRAVSGQQQRGAHAVPSDADPPGGWPRGPRDQARAQRARRAADVAQLRGSRRGTDGEGPGGGGEKEVGLPGDFEFFF